MTRIFSVLSIITIICIIVFSRGSEGLHYEPSLLENDNIILAHISLNSEKLENSLIANTANKINEVSFIVKIAKFLLSHL